MRKIKDKTKDNIKEAYLHNVQSEWKAFIEEKRQEKDIRFLFLTTSHFFDKLSSFKIIRAIWKSNPYLKKNPGYIIRLQYTNTGIQMVTGEWGKSLRMENTKGAISSGVLFKDEELEILRTFFEEFKMDEIITNLDEIKYRR